MELKKVGIADADNIAPLAAAFRIQLKSYKGIKSQPNIEAGREEILEFLESGFPVYAVEDRGVIVGYMVCKINEPCLWVEHIFVREDYRRKGVATMLLTTKLPFADTKTIRLCVLITKNVRLRALSHQRNLFCLPRQERFYFLLLSTGHGIIAAIVKIRGEVR